MNPRANLVAKGIAPRFLLPPGQTPAHFQLWRFTSAITNAAAVGEASPTMRVVRFEWASAPYRPGEQAGFAEAIAIELVESGVATPIGWEPQ